MTVQDKYIIYLRLTCIKIRKNYKLNYCDNYRMSIVDRLRLYSIKHKRTVYFRLQKKSLQLK